MAERGRPRSFDRDAALRAAMRVFWRQGYQGASIADLTQAMGIAPPSLYAAFGDKRALYLEALGLYGETLGARLWAVLDGAPSAREGVGALFALSAAQLTRPDQPRYCMAVMADGDCDELRAETRSGRAGVQAMLQRRFERAAAEGELPPGVDVAALARFYATIQQGLSIQARDGATETELKAVARQALTAWPTKAQ